MTDGATSSLLRALLLLITALASHHRANACIYKFGTSPDSMAAHPSGTAWDFKALGDDWDGVDGANQPWVCLTGATQSPINIPKEAVDGDASLRTKWSYPVLKSNGSDLEIVNNGHVIQVEWKYEYDGHMDIIAGSDNTALITDILSRGNAASGTKRVKGVPAQFHFHVSSEHLIFGVDYPLELHIVHFIDKSDMPACTRHPRGCISVTGILFELRDGPDNPALNAIFDNLPLREGVVNPVPSGGVIDLGAIIPPVGKRAYHQYAGSLTTPPCLEGLLWHVFEEPSYLSTAQYRKLLLAVSDKFCEDKDHQTNITLNPRVPYDTKEVHDDDEDDDTDDDDDDEDENEATPASRKLLQHDKHQMEAGKKVWEDTEAAKKPLATGTQHTEHSEVGTVTAHRKLMQHASHADHHDHSDHAHHQHGHIGHIGLEAARKLLPKYQEVRVAELPLLRRDSDGRLLMESSPHRVLVADAEGEHANSNMVCVVYGYARDTRLPQPINGRIIKYFADLPEGSRMYNCSRSLGVAAQMNGGEIISSTVIKSDGWAHDDHAKNQEQCKKICNAKQSCQGFTYKTNRKCILVKKAGGWKDASKDVLHYDSCMAVQA